MTDVWSGDILLPGGNAIRGILNRPTGNMLLLMPNRSRPRVAKWRVFTSPPRNGSTLPLHRRYRQNTAVPCRRTQFRCMDDGRNYSSLVRINPVEQAYFGGRAQERCEGVVGPGALAIANWHSGTSPKG